MKKSNIKSFTLIESLVATIITIIVALAFFACFMTAFKYARRIMELRTASLILQERVSIVRELPFQDIGLLGSTFTAKAMSSLRNAQGTITQSAYGGSDKIIKITFGLDWADFDGTKQHKTVVTLMTDHGINKK